MKKQYITTQKTTLTFQCQINQESLVLEAPFYTLVRQQFTPLKLILLRILNITIMRSPTLGNIIKKIMVSMLISGQSMIPLICKRIITFEKNKLIIHDTISSPKKAKLLWLSGGVPFNAIHMASSGYFEGLAKPSAAPKHITNIQDLFTEGKIVINNILNFS